MDFKLTFSRRIVIAFVLMTLVVSGAFALSIVGVVHFIEQHLGSEEMHRELLSVLHEDLTQGRAPRLDAKTRFYASNLPEYAIPDKYAGLEEGFTEVIDGEEAFYVYSHDINGVRYVLLQEQSDFEAHEQALFSVVLAGFILSVLGAWILGRFMARHVMAPLSRLAQQVSHRDPLLPTGPDFARDYPDDEVGQLARAFAATLGELRQSLERERLFTSDVSHELRTPLMIIATSCELLEQASLPPRQHELLQRSARAAKEMGDLVQTFLQLARGRNDVVDMASTATLAQVADQQAKYLGQLITEKGLRFECVVESEDIGRYSATLLGAVMANLLRNALHYTEQGFVRLFLHRGGFRVEDSGPGISPDQQEAIFLPFVRGRATQGEGLGLGLSLVQRICAHQGWSISVHNLSPVGSCFAVGLHPTT